VADVPCKFNLIPFNPFPESGLKRSNNEQIRRFAQVLMDAGIVTTIRKTRGDDIDAACGQLAGEVMDRTRLAERGKFGKITPLVPVADAGAPSGGPSCMTRLIVAALSGLMLSACTLPPAPPRTSRPLPIRLRRQARQYPAAPGHAVPRGAPVSGGA
jgi:hypothetical protein